MRLLLPLLLASCGLTLAQAPTSPSPAPASAFAAPEFAGSYCPDGKFRTAKKLESFLGPLSDGESFHQRKRPAEVPPWINLRDPKEVVVENFVPPYRATAAGEKKSNSATVVQSVVSAAYGREAALQAPVHLVTDSRHRLIVSDSQRPAVYVLDGKKPLRIAAGPGRRLERPIGVAVDADDNIYVADRAVGMVAVFDREGRFLRYLGSYKDDRIFTAPTGIAIDQKNRRLYVLDSPASEVIVLDLEGNVVERAGGLRGHAGVQLDFPTEIALRDSTLAIVDGYGARVQVYDLQWRHLGRFTIGAGSGSPNVAEMGLALDRAGNIYLSNAGLPGVRAYRQDGQPIGSFENFGLHKSQFNTPSGIWFDGAERLYVADTNHSRIHVFQPPQTAARKKGKKQ